MRRNLGYWIKRLPLPFTIAVGLSANTVAAPQFKLESAYGTVGESATSTLMIEGTAGGTNYSGINGKIYLPAGVNASSALLTLSSDLNASSFELHYDNFSDAQGSGISFVAYSASGAFSADGDLLSISYPLPNSLSGDYPITFAATDLVPEINTKHALASDTGESLSHSVKNGFLYAISNTSDRDNDGTPDINDNDDDNDLILDTEELVLGTSPLNRDTDNDGMEDGYEVAYSLNPLVDDAYLDKDGDGYTNIAEHDAGTNPDDDTSLPAVLYAANDFNDDGISDVLIRNSDTNGWYSYFLDSDRTFKSLGGVALTADANWRTLAIRDFDDDGFADVLVRNQSTGSWFLYTLDGNNGVSVGKTLPLNNDTNWIFQGADDFNNDGFTDILIRHASTNAWYIYYLDGNGALSTGSGQPPLTAVADWEFRAIADFNGDNFADILIRHKTTGQWHLYHLDGANAIATNSGPVSLPTSLDLTYQGVADLNVDGTTDVLLRSTSSGSYSQQILDGARSVIAAESGNLDASTASLDWELQLIGQLTSDQTPDFLVRHKTNGSWYLWALDGQQGVTADSGSVSMTSNTVWQIVPKISIAAEEESAVVKNDFNSDGLSDVLIRNTETGRWWLYYLDGSRTPLATSGGLPLTTDGNWQVQAKADFNGDGHLDVLIRNSVSNGWYVYQLDGNRGLADGSGYLPLTLRPEWQFRAARDFNGDGNVDILIRNEVTGGWYVYHLNGNKGLATGSGNLPITSSTDWKFKASEDFNGDGHADILIRNSANNGWYLYHLNGNRGLSTGSGSLPLTANVNWQFKTAKDFNGDGNPDVLIRNASNKGWYVYLLNGDKGLAAGSSNLPMTASPAWEFRDADDFNGDEKPDILIRNVNTGGWYIYHLDGNAGLATGSGYLPLATSLDWVYK